MALVAATTTYHSLNLAQRLINWADLHPPMDVEEAARRLGLDIEEIRMSGSVAGMLIREEPKRWLIVLNSKINHPGRRRFTIAHELGHWVMHRPRLKETSLELDGQWEREANEFASHLLMPPDLLEEQVRLFGLSHLERHFDVSTAAAAAALRRLGYRVYW